MIESHDYYVELDNTEVKTGTLRAGLDGLSDIDVASPPEFGGPAGVWTPEHLFVAAVSVCLMTTFRAIAEASGLEVIAYSDNPSGHLQRGDNRLYRFETVTLRPRVLISDEGKVDRALRLLDKAEHVCLVSRSISSEIVLKPVIEVTSTASA